MDPRPPHVEIHERSRAKAWPRQLEPALYALFAGTCTLLAGCLFYSSLRLQTLYSRIWNNPAEFGVHTLVGDWSAPLDDVFIHFDFARCLARGFPFEWSQGNGYSSGGTSLLYPFVLAIGYLAGYRRLSLMAWAALLALISVFAFLLGSRRMFRVLPPATSYVLPPALLCTGVLNWNLFSGMEVAFFLALWAGALLAWDDLSNAADDSSSLRRRALGLGACGALLVATRPEAVTTLAVFAVTTYFALRARVPMRSALSASALAFLPGAALLVLHALANRVLTGDSTTAGARVKLELYHPYLTRSQIIEAWWFHFKYQIFRITEYHLSASGRFGWIAWFFATVPLFSAHTRRYAVLLWASALAWMALVALNGQVRWQNERYAMPALAFMLLASALGVALTLAWVAQKRHAAGALVGLVTIVAIGVFVHDERPRFREQVWFFGRAARNILDQHLRTGALLRRYFRPIPHRILVGDAGAIPYESDLPALDIIGLGGYHDLPFARATQLGVGASIELIEHMPAQDRPDVFAIYPSWWGSLPLWFGDRIPGGEVPVRGNVICGGPSKVLYRANWKPLEDSSRAFSINEQEKLVDSLDLADVLSENAHAYRLSPGAFGHVDMKMLAHPQNPNADLWDAGRVLFTGQSDAFELHGFRAGSEARLIFRVAPASSSFVRVSAGDTPAGTLELTPFDGWRELSVRIAPELVKNSIAIRLTVERGERILYHVWAVQAR